MNLRIARQPIFDPRRQAVAYQLLYRSDDENRYKSTDPDRATWQFISEATMGVDLRALTNGLPAYIHVTRDVLLGDEVSLLPPDLVVPVLDESVVPDLAVMRACLDLKERGYRIAVRSRSWIEHFEPIVGLVDIVRIESGDLPPDARIRITARVRGQGLVAMADKVETWTAFSTAVSEGCELFQGYFFAEPEMLTRPSMAGHKATHLAVLNEVSRDEPDVRKVEAALKRDAVMTYRLLKYVNSPWFSWRAEIRSVRHALTLLGDRECRRWATVVALSGIAEDKPSELIVLALQRARLLESLAPLASMEQRAEDLYLLGLFSLLPAMADRPMETIVRDIAIGRDIRKALLGGTSRLRQTLDLCLAYEQGDWRTAGRLAARLSVDEGLLPGLYTRSTEYADTLTRVKQEPRATARSA